MGHNVLDHEGKVRQVFYTSTDAHLLVFGKGYHGHTVLSKVAAEMYPRIVILFLNHGARIRRRNDQGRTPPMGAALWGGAGSVLILLAKSADQKMKDQRGCKTIDFTTRSEEHTEKDVVALVGSNIEDTFDADRQRKAIRRTLDSQNLTSTAPFDLSKPRTPSYDYHSFHRSSITSKVVLSEPVTGFPVPLLTKMIARLERGRPFSSVDAMSVLKRVIFNNKTNQLDRVILSYKVRDRLLDFKNLD